MAHLISKKKAKETTQAKHKKNATGDREGFVSLCFTTIEPKSPTSSQELVFLASRSHAQTQRESAINKYTYIFEHDSY